MRKLVVALAATFAVLLATGIYQAFRYQPGPTAAWGRQQTMSADRGFLYDATELVHRYGAYVFCALVVAVIVAWILRERGTSRSMLISVVVLVVLALATLAQMITGRGLRWDQLALWAVTVGSSITGVVDLPSGVKYVIVGTNELSSSEFSTRVFLHLVLFPIGIVLCGAVLWFLSVRNDRRRGALAGSTETADGNDDHLDLDPDLEPNVTEAPT